MALSVNPVHRDWQDVNELKGEHGQQTAVVVSRE